jgi:hypothetical protein
MATLTIQATVPFGASLRVGYRIISSSSPFTYLDNYLSQDDLPHDILDLPLGSYEVELTTVCPNCSGAKFGDPIIYEAVTL